MTLRSWPTLICFEIIYKIVGFSLLINLMDVVKKEVLRICGVDFIGQENIGLLFTRPLALLLILSAFLLVVYYVYFEITALLIYCNAGLQNRYVSLWELARRSVQKSFSLFHYKNLPVILALIPLTALSIFPLTSGFLREVDIPEFIMDFIKGSSVLLPLFFAALVLLNVLLFFYLFSFPAVILEGEHFWGSLHTSMSLLKGRKIRTLLRLFGCFLLFLAAAFAGFLLMVLLLWLFCKGTGASDGGRSLFEFYYVRWSGMGAIALNILGSVVLFSAVIYLYNSYKYQGRERPDREKKKRNPGKFLLRTGAVVIAFVLLQFYSETELGANLYLPTHFDTEVVAHRAGAAFGPENTVASLKTAIKSQADMAEIDVQQTRDGVLIIMHDDGFKRTTGFDQKVWDTDYATAQKLDTGSSFSDAFAGETIPSLKEMLAAAKGKIGLMIELKATGHEHSLVEKTVEQIRKAGMEEQCTIASMNLELLKKSKALDPAVQTVYITSVLFSDLYDLPYVDAYSVETTFLTGEMVAQVHAEKRKIYAWTANQGENMKKILHLGADGIVTDNPELARYYLDYADENYLLQAITDVLYE